MKLYEVLAMIDCTGLELPLYANERGQIDCAPQSIYKVTIRTMSEGETAVTFPISSPLLIPWYDCKVLGFSPNDVQNSMDVWLDYSRYVLKKWKSKVLQEDADDAGRK